MELHKMLYPSVLKHNGKSNDFNACFVNRVLYLKHCEALPFLRFTIHMFRDANSNYDTS
jgi:hypothetical protein